MIRVLFTAIFFLGAFACSTPAKFAETNTFVALTKSNQLLGPEAFDFCEGWIEFWAQVDEAGKLKFFLKSSPPAGKKWAIWNDHILIEHPHWPNKRLQFSDVHALEIGEGVEIASNVIEWDLDIHGLNPVAGIEVTVKPFEGCSKPEELRGVVLSPSF